jgi:hypothetical protein
MDHYITLTYRQTAPFIRRLGMYHTMEITLAALKGWLVRNRIDFNFENIQEKEVIKLTSMARSESECITFIISTSKYLV